MKKIVLFLLMLAGYLCSFAQLERPKLVVGIVVDQMRWDYLYRYYDLYSAGGFKRMLREGYSCENTLINYLPSYTAVGHSAIFTGAVPAVNGITGNDWIFTQTGKSTYCTQDTSVQSVGVHSTSGQMSPHFLMTTTITDALRLATNFKGKVVGVSLKDRASILPAGHNPNGAYWLDDPSGRFITSTYYKKELPGWVTRFNQKDLPAKLMQGLWKPLRPIADYDQSTADNVPWEGLLPAAKAPIFPYDLKAAYAKDKGALRQTPFGNTLTLQFAQAAIAAEALGQDNVTDFLTINCAATDYAGHLLGTNAIEVEDVYLRLDKDLATFFSFLDKKVGKDNYMVFLSADHGGANAVGFMEHNKMPTGYLSSLSQELNAHLQKKFGVGKLVTSFMNDQVHFDHAVITTHQLNLSAIKTATIQYLRRQPSIAFVMDASKPGSASVPAPIKEMIINGYNPKRSGAIKVIYNSGMMSGHYTTGTTHGSWYNYDTHIPLIFMGWKIPHGASNKTVHITDIAPTIAALLHIQMPSGCTGQPITAITDQIKNQ